MIFGQNLSFCLKSTPIPSHLGLRGGGGPCKGGGGLALRCPPPIVKMVTAWKHSGQPARPILGTHKPHIELS